jgi:hypothetical protein
MPRVKVSVKGIAICSFDEQIKNWRIFVPKIVEEHEFIIKVTRIEGSKEEVMLDQSFNDGQKITLSNNNNSEIGENEPIFLQDSLNFSEIYAREIPLVEEIDKYAAFITLRGFPSLMSEPVIGENKKQFFKIVKESDNSTVILSKGCTDGILSFLQAEVGSESSILVVNRAGQRSTLSLPHENGVDYDVLLENDCHRVHNPNDPSFGDLETDFKFYYNIIDPSVEKVRVNPIPAKCEVAGCQPGVGRVKAPKPVEEYLNS